jgi:transposase, IS5 family
MKPKRISREKQGNFLYPELMDQLNPKDPLLVLGKKIPWKKIEDAFIDLYSNKGRRAKPIRLMVGLLILKQLEDLSDEEVVQAWVRNPYYQVFCGESRFRWQFPCDPSDLTYFRKRIGEKGAELIFKVSVELHGNQAKEKEIVVDTTVQEKNITFPTDTKLLKKVIEKCRNMASECGIKLRRSFKRELPGLLMKKIKSKKVIKRIRTMAGVLIRELERKLPKEKLASYADQLNLFVRVHNQKINSKKKIYSLHEPDVSCIAKGKDHKKYEFGSKVSFAMTKTNNILVGVMNFSNNPYDGHTLPPVLEQVEDITGLRPQSVFCDRGYKGKKMIKGTSIFLPGAPKKDYTPCQKRKMRQNFRRRVAIEPVIGHVKNDFRMDRNYLKGIIGDAINAFMSAAAFNFRKLLRNWGHFFIFLYFWHLKLSISNIGNRIRQPLQAKI